MALGWFKKEKKESGVTAGEPGVPVEDKIDAPGGDEAQTPREETDTGAIPKTKTDGFFSRLKRGLSKTRDFLTTDIEDLFARGAKVDEDFLENLEAG